MSDSALRDWHEVKGWHVVFLFFVIWLGAGLVTHYVVPQFADAQMRWNYRAVFAQTITAVLFSIVVLLNRTLRRFSFEACRTPQRRISRVEMVASIGFMYLWAFGGYRSIVGAANVYGESSFWYGFFGLTNSVESLRDHHLPLTLLISVVIAPILEEFVFRAVMLRVWLQSRSVWTSITLSSLAFGAIHSSGFFFATIAGVLFALLYLSYGSIWPAVFVHAAHNLIASIPAVRERAYLRDLDTVDKWSAWSIEIALAILFVPLAIWLLARLAASPVFPQGTGRLSRSG